MNLLPFPAATEHNPAFTLHMPAFQTTWDSTSFTAFQRCPFRYYLSSIQGLHPLRPSPHLSFGIAFHSAVERYHHLRSSNLSHEDALFSTVRCTYFRQLRTPIERLFRPQAQGHHEESLPLRHSLKTPHTLLRTLIAYLDHYVHDKWHTVILPSGAPAVELPFRFPLPLHLSPNPALAPFWSGRLDRLITRDHALDLRKPFPSSSPPLYVTDIKTTMRPPTKQYFDQYHLSTQITGYLLGTSSIFPLPPSLISPQGAYIDLVHLTKKGQLFHRHLIKSSPHFAHDFMHTVTATLKNAFVYASSQEWPKNYTSCFSSLIPCPYTDLCLSPPSNWHSILSTNYIRRPWIPPACSSHP